MIFKKKLIRFCKLAPSWISFSKIQCMIRLRSCMKMLWQMERRRFNHQAWHWMDINIMFLHIPSWWVMVLPPCLRIFQMDTMHWSLNELHYITLNHLYLLNYNYIIVPFPSGFCECMSSCGRCVRIPHSRQHFSILFSKIT